jgi:acyl carrier protein
MTEKQFMQMVCSIRRIKDANFLDLPMETVSFDSLDLLELRVAMEDLLGVSLTNEKFNSASNLRDLYLLVSSHGETKPAIPS